MQLFQAILYKSLNIILSAH